MLSGDQPVTMVMNDCCCSSMQKPTAEKPATQGVNQVRKDCRVTINCSCCVDQAPNGNAAPISQNTSAKIVALPVKDLGQSATSPPRTSSAEHTFARASQSAPPLFLKNCSFLN